MRDFKTEDIVRDGSKITLGFDDGEDKVNQGTGQLTSFKSLAFKSVSCLAPTFVFTPCKTFSNSA